MNEDKIILVKLEEVKWVEVFLHGSGNPNDYHDIVGVRWIDKNDTEHGLGKVNHKEIHHIEKW